MNRVVTSVAVVVVSLALAPLPAVAAPAAPPPGAPPVFLVADLEPGEDSSRPEDLTPLGDTLYFGASTFASGFALWGYRPASAGGSGEPEVLDPFGAPFDLEPLDGLLYYQSGFGEELRSYDPGTGQVEVEVARGGPDAPFGGEPVLAALGGRLYYPSYRPDQGYELWEFDPAAAGGQGAARRIAQNIAPGAESAAPRFLTPLDGKLYLQARNAERGAELWVYDPATDIATLAADIRPGAASGDPVEMLPVAGGLVFRAEDASGEELWRYDVGTGAASLVADIFSGPESSLPRDFVQLGGKVYFGAEDPDRGTELWRLDPVSGSVRLVADVSPIQSGAFPGSNPSGLTVFDGRVYFAASYNKYTVTGASDLELWEFDPAANGGTGAASLVAEIRPGSSRYAADSAEVDGLAALGDTLYFEARGPAKGKELWGYRPGPVELAAAVLGGDEIVAAADSVEVNVFVRNRTGAPIPSALRLEVTYPDGRRRVSTSPAGDRVPPRSVAVFTLVLPLDSSAPAGDYTATVSLLGPGGEPRLRDSFGFTLLPG